MHQQNDTNIKKKIEQVARKTIRQAIKTKDPKTFQQKYKTIDGRLLTHIPHTAWAQTKGKKPRLLRNSGFAFVPNLQYVAHVVPHHSVLMWHMNPESRTLFAFFRHRKPLCTRESALRHPIFKEDASGDYIQGPSVKLTRKKQQTSPAKTKGNWKKNW